MQGLELNTHQGAIMIVRRSIASAVLAAGLAGLATAAAAQFLPPPYSYPQGGYRGVPDQDGVMTIDPDDERAERQRPPRRSPYVRNDEQGAPYPYDPRPDRYSNPYGSRDPRLGQQPEPYRDPNYDPANPNPYDPRAGRQQASPEINPAPNYGAPRGPFGHYGDPNPADSSYAARPGDAPTSLRPPGVVPSPLPPLAVPGTEPQPTAPSRPNTVAALPPEDQPEEGEPKELPPQFKRQIVPYVSKEPAGTIVIDTPSTYLYYVLGDGNAVRYGIGVGREGFTWSGTEKITKLAEWPDWHPPAEMIERQPYLPRFMAGGPGNPLGARALYLGKTIYRIHGTNQPSTIGKFVSSGCIRMLNDDVEDLYTRVKVGTRVVVRPGGPPTSASSSSAPIAR